MDVTTNRQVISLVNYMAMMLVRKYPKLELEDVQQDCWVEVLKVINNGKYRSDTGATLETFLFRHLHWRMMNYLNLTYRRDNNLAIYAQTKPTQHEPMAVAFHSLCQAVFDRLKPAAHQYRCRLSLCHQVFDHYINSDHELGGSSQVDLARAFGVSAMTITRAMKVIRQAAQEVIDGQL